MITKLVRIVVLSYLFSYAHLLFAQQSLPSVLTHALSQTGIPFKNVGIFAQVVGESEPFVAFNADYAMNPASTMKLLTTYAGLDILGPAYTWKTEVYTNGSMQGDVLDGDLIIKGYGDPKLTLENFWLLLRNLRQRGIREIRGDLILDRTYFSVGEDDPGRFDNEPIRPYNVGPDALLVNYKSLRVQFVPEPEKKKVRIFVEPSLPQLKINNALVLKNAACGDWVSKLAFDVQPIGKHIRLTLSGSYSTNCGEKIRHVSLLSHEQYVYGLFVDLWKELGGNLSGKVRQATTPNNARLIASFDSAPLAEIIRDINKFSNNVMARHLFLTIGAETYSAPGNLDKAAQAIKQWLTRKNLGFAELILENGSGLSRKEQISTRHLAILLLDAYRHPFMPEFIASLPIVSTDGTMKKRLNGSEVANHAHIKTGSLEGVKSIAGYVLDNKGRTVAVVAIINHPQANQAAQPVFDNLLEWIYQRQ